MDNRSTQQALNARRCMLGLDGRLSSQRGASIIIALIFLLICTVIAVVIITAASTNADRTSKRADEQQAYFALSSAIEKARTQFYADAETGTLELVFSGSAGSTAKTTPAGYTANGLAAWMDGAAQTVMDGGTPADHTTIVTAAVTDGTSKGQTLPAVTLKYSMDASWNITVEAYYAATGDAALYAHHLTETITHKEKGTKGSSGFSVWWGTESAQSSAGDLGAPAVVKDAMTTEISWGGGYGTAYRQTRAMQEAYFAMTPRASQELTDAEKKLLPTGATGVYGWKPMLTTSGDVFAVACTNYATTGAASDKQGKGWYAGSAADAINAVLVYYNGNYYQLRDFYSYSMLPSGADISAGWYRPSNWELFLTVTPGYYNDQPSTFWLHRVAVS